MERLVAVDQYWTLWINHHHHVLLDWVLMPVSWAGEAGVGWLVVMGLLLVFGRRRERLATLVFLAGLLLMEFVLVPQLRDLWPRPRPYAYLPDVRQLGVRWETTSFPSGHMYLWTAAAVLYGGLYRRWRWPLVVLTAITAYSRPYGGMHHVLDVLGGAVLGGAVGTLELLGAWKLGLRAGREGEPSAGSGGDQGDQSLQEPD